MSSIEEIEENLRSIKRRRTRTLTEDQRLDILHMYYACKRDHLRAKTSGDQAESRVSKANARERVVQALGYGSAIVSKTFKDWREKGTIEVATPPANRHAKTSRIPPVKEVLVGIRTLIRHRAKLHLPTTVNDVNNFLLAKKYVTLPAGSAGSAASGSDRARKALARATQRYMRVHGFRTRTGRGAVAYVEAQAIRDKRDVYVDAILRNRALPPTEQLREVYIGESYVHLCYRCNQHSIFNANDSQDLVTRTMNSFDKYCFALAIQGRKPCSASTPPSGSSSASTYTNSAVSSGPPAPVNNDVVAAGIVPNSFWHFASNKPCRDFRSSFSNSDFILWMTQSVFPCLREPSLIILEDAKPHVSSQGVGPCINGLDKHRLREFLHSVKIPFSASDPAVTLRLKAKEWERSNVRPAIVQAAERLGHKVVFLPVSYSDLQPLYPIWNHIKTRIGSMAPKNMNLLQLGEKLVQEVCLLEQDPALVERAIDDITPRLLEYADEDVATFARGDDELDAELDREEDDGDNDDDDEVANESSGSASDEEAVDSDASEGEFAV